MELYFLCVIVLEICGIFVFLYIEDVPVMENLR